MRHGIPIMLGYFSVSFGFGVLCIQKNLSMLAAVGISVTNLTSAGQVAGVEVIAASGSLIEMILCQLVINLRYSLMSLSLSQKLDPSFSLMHRLFAGYGVTDEIFAVASAQTEPLTPAYMYGLILTPFLGWSSGTLLGALAGDIMPASVTAALSLMKVSARAIQQAVPLSKPTTSRIRERSSTRKALSRRNCRALIFPPGCRKRLSAPTKSRWSA